MSASSGVDGSHFLGIDVGTTATRVTVIAEDGTQIATGSASYSTSRDGPGVAEQDPRDWTSALADALGRAEIERWAISAIGLCGQTPTVVLVDAAGRPLRRALLWQDVRAVAEARELAARLGDPEPLVGTALPWSAANMPAKLLWLSRHEPSLLASTYSVLQPKDFVAMQLSGVSGSDPWSSKGLCRVDTGAPAIDVLEACGWPTSCCPVTAPAWEARGETTKDAAEQFGLPAGTPVTVGWSDALAQVIAAGCFSRSSAFAFSGTSSIVGSPVEDPNVRAGGLFSVPASCAPSPLLYGPTQSSGSAILWAARLLGCKPEEVAELGAQATSSQPTFVPYLSGERAPLWNEDVRALLVGVAEEHGRAELARAVVSGVLFSARHVLELVARATGSPIREVEIVGRGVGDSSFEAIAGDSMMVPLRFHEDPDMSARGAAMLAAMSLGWDLATVGSRLSDRTRRLEVDETRRARSGKLFEDYLAASALALTWSAR
jgi:xylulokinase